MDEPTRALDVRLEEIIRRNPVPTDPDEDDFAWKLARANELCDERFPARYVDAEADHDQVATWVREYRASARRARSLLLSGPTGTGKTHQAYGALRAAVSQQKPIRWYAISTADLYAKLRGHVDVEAELRPYLTCSLLLLDDLGAARSTEWVEEITYRLIDGRYRECRPSIFTTNLPTAELKAALGDRIASRLAETCTRVVLSGPDRRRTGPRESA